MKNIFIVLALSKISNPQILKERYSLFMRGFLMLMFISDFYSHGKGSAGLSMLTCLGHLSSHRAQRNCPLLRVGNTLRFLQSLCEPLLTNA